MASRGNASADKRILGSAEQRVAGPGGDHRIRVTGSPILAYPTRICPGLMAIANMDGRGCQWCGKGRQVNWSQPEIYRMRMAIPVKSAP